MNTNSKHYEELNIQPWEIMERNFTTEEFAAYLKGNIIKYTLRDKGQDLSDAEKIKHYAEKLIEVIEKKETDEFLKEDAERIYGKHKFKVGDRVRVLISNKTGTIIRTPVEELKELLPVGTKVFVIKEYTTNNNDYNEEELGKEAWLSTTVQRVDKKHMTELTRVAIPNDIFFRRYFRIVEED